MRISLIVKVIILLSILLFLIIFLNQKNKKIIRRTIKKFTNLIN